MTKRVLEQGRLGHEPLTESVTTIPASNYYDPARWQREVDLLFKRIPIVVGYTAELREPHSYKAIDVVGVPILLTRGADGVVRGFVNMCSHRGAKLTDDGCGVSRRFTCPYHAWIYDDHGALVGRFKAENFGDIDAACYSLTPIAVVERAGIIWATLAPEHYVDVDSYLGGYDDLLAYHRFSEMHHYGTRVLDGPNWKVAYDGYVDFYHLPILHKNTFGPTFPSDAIFHHFGPHQRVTGIKLQKKDAVRIEGIDESQWPVESMIGGVWNIFPHVAIAGFEVDDAELYQIATLYPGDNADHSMTRLDFVSLTPPTPKFSEKVDGYISFLLSVVRDEDYATGNLIQKNVKTGAKKEFVFGRNEGGAQHIHGWIDRILNASDSDLARLF